MKLAIAGDSAGEGLAKVLAEHLKDRHDVAEVSRTEAGADPFYANLSDRVANEVLAGTYDQRDPHLRHRDRRLHFRQQGAGHPRGADPRHLFG